MFTGIVQGMGAIRSIENKSAVWTFHIDLPDTAGLERGASVAINGVCLTATDMDGQCVAFDVIEETLNRTNLGQLELGGAVNVERSLKMGDELGGHLLSGHIMGLGQIKSCTQVGEGLNVVIEAQQSMMKYIHEKGYIGLNGASLTIGAISDNQFNIHLIPETLRLTTFHEVKNGGLVNIEIDAMTQTIVATVERMMKQENRGGQA